MGRCNLDLGRFRQFILLCLLAAALAASLCVVEHQGMRRNADFAAVAAAVGVTFAALGKVGEMLGEQTTRFAGAALLFCLVVVAGSALGARFLNGVGILLIWLLLVLAAAYAVRVVVKSNPAADAPASACRTAALLNTDITGELTRLANCLVKSRPTLLVLAYGAFAVSAFATGDAIGLLDSIK
jgi:hypothetical protein